MASSPFIKNLVFPSRLRSYSFFSPSPFPASDLTAFSRRSNNPASLVGPHPAVNSSVFRISRSHRLQPVPSRTHASFRVYPAARFLCLKASCFSLPVIAIIIAPCVYINMVTGDCQEECQFFVKSFYIFFIFFHFLNFSRMNAVFRFADVLYCARNTVFRQTKKETCGIIPGAWLLPEKEKQGNI
jgi:hypothetical protein